MRLLYAEDTPYQSLAVYEHDVLGRVLVLDNIVQTTQADEFIYHEMFTHVPLLGAQFARQASHDIEVLIIGGGDGGILREVLRHHRVRKAVMVEIDEAVIRVSKEYLGIHGDYTDPRVELIIGDGMDYVREAEQLNTRFDLVLVDSTDPVGPGEVLFSVEFYQMLKACLKPKGVMVRHLGLPHIQQSIFATGVNRLHAVFGNVQVYRASIPTYIGGELAFAASTLDGHSIHQPHQKLKGKYYNPGIHTASFALPTFWQEIVEQQTISS